MTEKIYYIPFKTTKKDLLKSFKKSCKKSYIPNLYNKSSIINNIKQLYIPVYLLNLNVVGNTTLECTKINKFKNGVYSYTKSDIYKIVKEANLHFNNMIISKVKTIDNKKINLIGLYNIKDKKEYKNDFDIDTNYLTNDEFKINLDKYIKDSFLNSITKDLNKYEKIIDKETNIKTDYKSQGSILVPVWYLKFKYKKKEYYYIMNGQTKKTTYKLPEENNRLIKTSVTLFIILFIIFAIIQYLMVVL